MVVTGPSVAGAELEARHGLDALRDSPPTLFDTTMFTAAKPRCICRCGGARCKVCRAWVSKHDFTPHDAIACAASAPHHVCKPLSSRKEPS